MLSFDTLIGPTDNYLPMQTLPPTAKEESFRGWVRDYSDMLFRHAVLQGFDHAHAKDFVQDTFYSAWKNMDGFEGKASVKNWLFVILKNKITDHFRKHMNREDVHLSEYADSQFDERGHWSKPFYPRQLSIDPSDRQDRIDFHQILERCSSKLNAIQKAVFFMKYVDDLESDDICVQLSLSSNNYWTILHRAKVQLRACLEKNWLSVKRV